MDLRRSNTPIPLIARSTLAGFLLCFLAVSPALAQVILPPTPAGKALEAFLSAFNSGDETKIEAYVATYEPTTTAANLLSFRRDTGGFTLLAIMRSSPDAISFRVRGNGDHLEAFGNLQLATLSPPKVQSLPIRLIPPGATIENIILDAHSRQSTITTIATLLDGNYVYPELARKMNEAVAEHQKRGDYTAITNGYAFSEALTKDLRSVSHDLHLRVEYSPFLLPARTGAPGPSPDEIARYHAELEHNNCSFRKLEILSNNVGYLKFDEFADPSLCASTVNAAMNFLANVDAIIFDLRENGGGDPRMVAYIATYLFDGPTHISDIYNRKEDTTTQFWTSAYVPGKRLPHVPAFVLTSKFTFSGAEDFSYSLQALKRVTVVGETTGGGAHPVTGHPVGDHFAVMVPGARTLNPTTKTNWEGVGVKPDVPVAASEALNTAQKLAASEASPTH